MRAAAVNAAATTTTNYVGAPTATLSACGSAACTATFGTLTLTTTFVAEELISDTATYNDVGSFRLQLLDDTFANVDASDSAPAVRNITSAVINVGRFVPDHFAVSLNSPAFGAGCVAGSFTYVGQTFNYNIAMQPVITVTARNFANNPTALYAGAWARITNSTVTPATQTDRYSRFNALGGGATPALDPAGLPATTGDPAIGTFTAGVGTLTFGSGTGLLFTRSTTTPNAPFNADIALALNVIDADGAGFALNDADSCTTLDRANITQESYARNLNACETIVTPTPVTFAAGVGTLRLSAPGEELHLLSRELLTQSAGCGVLVALSGGWLRAACGLRAGNTESKAAL